MTIPQYRIWLTLAALGCGALPAAAQPTEKPMWVAVSWDEETQALDRGVAW